MIRRLAKACANAATLVLVLPNLLSFYIRARLVGADRALEGSTQLLSLLPGVWGQYCRRSFLRHAIAGCASTATVEFGTIFSQAAARIGERAYVGPRCHLGWVDIGDDALIADGVHIPSGGSTHGYSRLDVPIREQPGARRCVRVGRGAWIGSAAVVLADVGDDAIVAAGAVVTKPIPSRAIAAGVPARVIKYRE
jgi:acetyltransferase-like isoleucine patch superfamily enzyme